MYRLIGQDCVVRVTLGGLQDGVPNWGVAVALKAIARRVGLREGSEKSDTSSLGDTRRRQRIRRVYSDLELELLVPDTGAQFDGCIGQYAKVEVGVNGVYGAPYYGSITDHGIEVPDDTDVETLTIETDADGAV